MDDYLIKVNVFFIFLCLVGLIVIGNLVYYIYDINNDINREIVNIENKFPKCPEHNLECPENKCPKCPDCPLCPEMNMSSPNMPSMACPNISCPSVNEIVKGVFPGRNPKVVNDGKYFNIDPKNMYDGLSSTNFYDIENKFPSDKMKPQKPLRSYNITGEKKINNSIDNTNISYAQQSKQMLKSSDYNSNDVPHGLFASTTAK